MSGYQVFVYTTKVLLFKMSEICNDHLVTVWKRIILQSGACFTNDFYIIIQILWKLHLQILKSRSLQNFAHDTTAMLSRHIQNFVVIPYLGTELLWDEISIEW